MRVVLSTLEFGVNSTDLEVVQGSLEALAALAKCHHSAVASGANGIAAPQGALTYQCPCNDACAGLLACWLPSSLLHALCFRRAALSRAACSSK